MNRETLELLIQEFYNMGKESVEKTDVDMEALKAEISAIKGIGEKDEMKYQKSFKGIYETQRAQEHVDKNSMIVRLNVNILIFGLFY